MQAACQDDSWNVSRLCLCRPLVLLPPLPFLPHPSDNDMPPCRHTTIPPCHLPHVCARCSCTRVDYCRRRRETCHEAPPPRSLQQVNNLQTAFTPPRLRPPPAASAHLCICRINCPLCSLFRPPPAPQQTSTAALEPTTCTTGSSLPPSAPSAKAGDIASNDIPTPFLARHRSSKVPFPSRRRSVSQIVSRHLVISHGPWSYSPSSVLSIAGHCWPIARPLPAHCCSLASFPSSAAASHCLLCCPAATTRPLRVPARTGPHRLFILLQP
ncbi:hypothetical protein BS50DRAFT_362263 [Corynespora cassiicola Philippines]|uniref:Uncharacterized protein n=1 Tax=Corynespora cassiicola Philippines TaxID=1448308 RepID=A0A2T2NSF7_CORCC|nr:hypothetical protein BS50DRAFT_362263 [Corynespora cassiicola Philippines]